MQNKVLIVGASGLVGTAAAISFAGLAGTWLPHPASPRTFRRCQHRICPMDLQDQEACAAVCRKLKVLPMLSIPRFMNWDWLLSSDPTNPPTERCWKICSSLTRFNRHSMSPCRAPAYGAMVGPMRVPVRVSTPG